MRKLLIAAFLMPLWASAQQKMLTVEDAVLKQRSTLGPARLANLAWVPGSNKFVFTAKKNGKDCMVMQDAASLKTDTVLTVELFNDFGKKSIPAFETVERLPVITWLSDNSFRYQIKNGIFIGNTKTNNVQVVVYLPENAQHAELEPVSGKVAYTLGGNILSSYQNSYFDKAKKSGTDNTEMSDYITKDGNGGIVYGTSVHRNEFGIDKGIFWSPKGNRLAFYQMNEAMVTDYPIYNLNTKPAGSKNIKYPMAGALSHHVKVWVKDFVNNRLVMLQSGDPADQYLTNVSWHPAEEKVYIAIVNRGQNEMKLNEYDAVTGAFIKTLFTETHPQYVEPEHGMIFCKNNPKQFVWMSEADGFNHLYLYNTTGRLDKQLTQGKFDVTQFLGFSNDGTKAFYVAASEDGLERHAYSVDLATAKVKKLTTHAGVHQVMLSDNGQYLIDQYSNVNTPRRIIILDANGAERAELLDAKNPITDYKKCELRLFKIKAADGKTDLNCRMFLPADFDSTKKYPTLIYLYGGPHAQMVTNSWLGGADMWLYYMAQQGYVVFTMDNRGSANRGLAFENATHRNLGTEERLDQNLGVEFLKSRSYVDANRMGIYGWSFGGFMTITMMSKTNFFKAGVAGGPVIDWGHYEIMYTERYMDTPAENPKGYEESNLLNYVKDLKGRLLIIHGTDDDVVLWQHSLKYIKKCVDEGVQLDYFVYPEHLHNVMGKDRVHLMQKITQHFNDNL
ncbi:MAG: DPP IV N-terminal domain-containing protein [Bacteroidota bacterium]|jgi:dipeptidyl-peptidase-4